MPNLDNEDLFTQMAYIVPPPPPPPRNKCSCAYCGRQTKFDEQCQSCGAINRRGRIGQTPPPPVSQVNNGCAESIPIASVFFALMLVVIIYLLSR